MTSVYAIHPGRERYMSAFDPSKCASGVWTNDRAASYYQCNRKPVLQEDGHGWCKQHAPSTEKAREDARRAELDRVNSITERKYAIEAQRARVVEAAKAWAAVDIDADGLDAALYATVAELERLEAEAGS